MNGLPGGGEQFGVRIRIAAELAEIRFVPDWPEIHFARITLHRGAREGAIRLDAFRRAHVVKVRVVRQVAEQEEAVLATVLYQSIIGLEFVFALSPLDPFPGEVLPAPFDPGLLHRFEPRLEI